MKVETLLFCCQLQKQFILRADADAVALGDTALDCSEELLSSFLCCWCLLWISKVFDEFSADEFCCTLASRVASWCSFLTADALAALWHWVGARDPFLSLNGRGLIWCAVQSCTGAPSEYVKVCLSAEGVIGSRPQLLLVCNKAGAPSQFCLLYRPHDLQEPTAVGVRAAGFTAAVGILAFGVGDPGPVFVPYLELS
ncbi:hypothetical protein Nepgr_022880 [Nepenthes gracilis]|uniref:Uncharacterized protein n=1 Tax=Nepenthes gracilis TaxID=150966 RepID=A0AAD3T130_NEPGR|nr:hypothetical protein Nepgr_022880 [Nepenthes gracilis]